MKSRRFWKSNGRRWLCIPVVFAFAMGTKTSGAQQAIPLAEVIVVVEGAAAGVESEIVVIHGGKKENQERVTITEKNGKKIIKPAYPWKVGDEIFARPTEGQRYFNSPDERVPKKMVTLMVKPRPSSSASSLSNEDQQAFKHLLSNARAATVDGRYGASAMVHSELAWRFDSIDPALAEEYRTRAYFSAASALGVKDALYFNTSSEKYFMSHTFVSSLKEYQQNQGLSVNGRLDGQTLIKLAKRPYYAYTYLPSTEASGWLPPPRPAPIQNLTQLLTSIGADEESRSLITNASTAEQRQDWGLAALLYNEILQRFSASANLALPPGVSKSQLLNAIEAITVASTGKALSVEKPSMFDPVQGKFVASSSFVERVKQYQASQNKEQTGRLDYPTLAAIAGRDVGSYLRGVVK